MRTFLFALVLAMPAPCFAAVGNVVRLTGEALRTSPQGVDTPLKPGTEIELSDTVHVRTGELALRFNDASVVLLAEGSELEIREADFEGQERRSFVARLGLGTLWARVTHAVAGSTAKFEIASPQAVAGVRGTVFSVNASPEATHVTVTEGAVAVSGRPDLGGQPTELLHAKEAATVDHAGTHRDTPRALPAAFDRFVRDHERGEHDRDPRRERREEKRERRRER